MEADIAHAKENVRQMLAHLSRIDPSRLDGVLAQTTVREVPAEGFLLREGEVCRCIHLVVQGCLRYYYVEPHREVNSHFVREGMWANDYGSFISQQPSRLYIQALEDSVLLQIPHGIVTQMYDTIPELERAGRLIAEQEFLVLREAFVLHLRNLPTQRYEALQQAQPWVFARVPQRHIASYLGLTPESLSRLKRRLKSG